MNHYILIHRLMGPAILLLLGTVALLSQAHLVHFSIFVPLLLILIGVIKLAERAALAAEPYPYGAPYPGAPAAGAAAQPFAQPPAAAANEQTSASTEATHDSESDFHGGQL
jgi:hypothetical protein